MSVDRITANDQLHRQIARENDRSTHEWAPYAAWDAMSAAQREAAVALAAVQGERVKAIFNRFTAAGGELAQGA